MEQRLKEVGRIVLKRASDAKKCTFSLWAVESGASKGCLNVKTVCDFFELDRSRGISIDGVAVDVYPEPFSSQTFNPGATATVSGAELPDAKPSPEAKTVRIVTPSTLHGDDITIIAVSFNDEEDFQEYIRSVQCGGLVEVNKQEPKVLVRTFASLVDGGIYTYPTESKEAFTRVLGKIRHLQQAREEDEFGRALHDYARREEPDQGYELREDLRMQLIKDKKLAEQDVVVMGKTKAYVGRHKTYAKGAKPVKQIAERCKELAKVQNELPAIVQPALMVERPEPKAEPHIQKACRRMNVVRFQRNGSAIQVVNRMNVAGRSLRF